MTYYYWDEVNDNLFGEEDENGEVIASYTHEPGRYGELIAQERDGETRYYNYDGLGNTSELTDENQNVTDTYEYSAFGEEVERTGTTENPFGYKGALGYYTNSGTSDVYVRARTFEPTIGRWLSLDPLVLLDRYRYVHNNPANSVDPSGLITACCPFSTDVCNILDKPEIRKTDIVEVGGSYGIIVNFQKGCICDCDCCAVEVWIKGYYRIVFPDGTFFPIPHPQLPGSPPGVGLDENEFRQDSPRLLPSGCGIVERDEPTVRVPRGPFEQSTPNIKWDVHLHFELRLIDLCSLLQPPLTIVLSTFEFKITGPVKDPKIETSMKQCSNEQINILK